MTLEEIIKEKTKRLDEIPDAFFSSVEKSQKAIYNTLISRLGSLDLDANGFVKIIKKNLKIIDSIITDLPQITSNSGYLKALDSFISQFDKQVELTDLMLQKTLEKALKLDQAKIISQRSKKITFELLTGSSLEAGFYNPIKQSLEELLSSNASFPQMVTGIEKIVIGDTTQGKLLRYTKQIAKDAFSISDNAYTHLASEDNGIEFYSYVGGLIEDSRSFCVSRNGKFFHKKEIEAWATLQWDGKNIQTNENTIFQLRGGYNCNHSIIPISLISVPKEKIKEAINKGFFKPTEKEKELLGI